MDYFTKEDYEVDIRPYFEKVSGANYQKGFKSKMDIVGTTDLLFIPLLSFQ